MKPFTTLLLLIFISSCIPLKIAPKIDTDKVKIARKFKRDLPNQYAFIFEDPKDANEFYDFINSKYDLDFNLVDSDVPFFVGDRKFSLTFYEIEKADKTLNLLPIVIDASINDEDIEPLFEGSYVSRKR